jgi:hypothetical protein
VKSLIITLLFLAAPASFAEGPDEPGADRLEIATSASRLERRFSEVVMMRVTAIDQALGPILEGADDKIIIELAYSGDASYPRNGPAAYDPGRHTLTFRRNVVGMLGNGVRSWAKAYWPYYKNEDIRALLPAIELIDNALWMTHLQEAANRKGLSWPHEDCGSLDIQKRLGCEMLTYGAEASRRQVQPFFNTNRVDMIWPESLQELRVRRQDDTVYRDVQTLGGSMLVRPLIAEFGVPRVLQYIAQTPFQIQDDNVRASAQRYQEQARRALTANAIN